MPGVPELAFVRSLHTFPRTKPGFHPRPPEPGVGCMQGRPEPWPQGMEENPQYSIIFQKISNSPLSEVLTSLTSSLIFPKISEVQTLF